MESKTMKTRVSAIAVAVAMLLSLIPMVVLADDYGMQGSGHKLQMINPSDITVNSATDTEYVNTLNAPVSLTDGKASFQFKMDAFGGQVNSGGVATLQQKVDAGVTLTDANGSAVSGSAFTVTAVDTSAITFDLDVSGLAENTSYILTFTTAFTTGGGNWNLKENIKFNFTTESPAVPYGPQGSGHKLQMISPSDITVNSETSTEYVNTLNAPVALTDGKASFQFKMDAFGGQVNSGGVATMQQKVDAGVALTDASGNAVSGSALTVTAVDTSAITFDLDVGGLAENTSYILTFTTAFTTGGGNWNLKENIKFNFTTAGETEPDPDPETPTGETLVNYTDEQATSPAGTVFNIKFTYIDGEANQTDVPLYKVGDNQYRIDGLLDIDGMFRGTFKFRNAYGGKDYSDLYAGIYADPSDLTVVASGDPIEYVDRNFENDAMFAVDPSALLPGTTYYFVIKANSANGNQQFGSDVVFELKTAGEAPAPADPALVSSEGNELKARTNTTLTLENAPTGEGYTYKFIVYNTTTNQWYKLQDFGPETTFDWYTGPAGVKNLYVDIKDADGNVTRVALEGVNVTDSDLAVKSFTISPEGTLPTKSQATLTVEAEKGEAPYEYKFIVYNATTEQWYKLKDFGSEATFDWYTGPAGSKKLYVDVKDATGKVVRAPLNVTVQ